MKRKYPNTDPVPGDYIVHDTDVRSGTIKYAVVATSGPTEVSDSGLGSTMVKGRYCLCEPIGDKVRIGKVRIGEEDRCGMGRAGERANGAHPYWYALRRATKEECAIAGVPYTDDVEVDDAPTWVDYLRRK